MSIDLFVYAAGPSTCTRAQLLSVLAEKGWTAFCAGLHGGPKLRPPGALADDVILGSRDASVAASLQAVIEKGSENDLEQFWNCGKAASCSLNADPLDDDERKDMLDEFEENFGKVVADRLRTAKVSYYVRTSMGRSDSDFELQAEVWEALGKLTGGLMDDPQSGEFHEYSGGKRRPVPVEE